MPADYVMVKLDFANAFNSLHRHDMLLSVFNRLPELYAYCHSAYGQPSILFHGSYIISSEEGPQQGDPIGPHWSPFVLQHGATSTGILAD